jgi:hypothetical protein
LAYFAPPSATQRQALRRLRSSNSAGENPAQLMLRITGLQICWILRSAESPQMFGGRSNSENGAVFRFDVHSEKTFFEFSSVF